MRRALLVLIGVIAVVGGALFSYSWMSNRAAAAGLEEWADTLRAGGYEVTLGGVSVSGFPSPDLTTVDGIEIAKPAVQSSLYILTVCNLTCVITLKGNWDAGMR
jgi:hypothetical protein